MQNKCDRRVRFVSAEVFLDFSFVYKFKIQRLFYESSAQTNLLLSLAIAFKTISKSHSSLFVTQILCTPSKSPPSRDSSASLSASEPCSFCRSTYANQTISTCRNMSPSVINHQQSGSYLIISQEGEKHFKELKIFCTVTWCIK